MSRYGVTPNMLVLPPQMLLYMALAPEQKLTCAIILNSNLATSSPAEIVGQHQFQYRTSCSSGTQ
jgi:hypothetical protein